MQRAFSSRIADATTMKSFLVVSAGILSFLYLVFPSFGVFELLPDYIPFIGNVDEATATMVLLGSLRYFGMDLTNLFRRRPSVDFGTTR
ncbi:MAG: DUF1232 domain-containing protein [Flavobacteriales bacterium]|nr:DUF1232 domain-containing protein [Flavobacteriales bacterium]